MKVVLVSLILIFAFLTLLPILKIEHWVVRIWDYPRKQFLIAHFVLLFLYLLFFYKEINWVALIASLVSIIFLIIRILPYTSFYPLQLANTNNKENTISILISNVEMKNDNYSALLQTIENKMADVVMLLETDITWQKNLEPIEKYYKYKRHHPQDDTYGILFYSNKEIRNHKYQFLVNDSIPSINCEIKVGNEWVQFYGLHPEPPFPTQSKTTVERDAEILQVAKKIAENENAPTIVAGDLNDVAWSYTTRLFQKMSRMLDPRIGRGFYSTFHAGYFWARWPLDHIFVSKQFQLVTIERLNYVGSDHFPIFIDLSLTHTNQNEKPEKIDEKEKKTVEEKIERPNEQD